MRVPDTDIKITKYFADIDQARCIFNNVHKIVRRMTRYRYAPLWVLMQDLTAHGSHYSSLLTKQLGYNPDQMINSKITASTEQVPDADKQ